MNFFGIEISLAKNQNGKYVKKDECHKVHNELTRFLDEKFTDTNTRINDLMNSINNYISLLRK